MNEMVKMAVILTILASVAGGVLSAVHQSTEEQIHKQQLEFVKGPAIKSIMAGAFNNPMDDHFEIINENGEQSFFVGTFDGKANAIAFEEFGKGFGGEIGVMVGFDLENDTIRGVSVTVHSETPGLGAKSKSDPAFVAQFSDMVLTDVVKVSKDGGQIDAISGATITSRAVCSAVVKSMEKYQNIKPQLEQEVQKLGK